MLPCWVPSRTRNQTWAGRQPRRQRAQVRRTQTHSRPIPGRRGRLVREVPLRPTAVPEALPHCCRRRRRPDRTTAAACGKQRQTDECHKQDPPGARQRVPLVVGSRAGRAAAADELESILSFDGEDRFDVDIVRGDAFSVVRVHGEPSLEQLLSIVHVLGIETQTWQERRLLVDVWGVESRFSRWQQVRIGVELAGSLLHMRKIASVVRPSRSRHQSEGGGSA